MKFYHVYVLLMPGKNADGEGVLEIPQLGSAVHGPRDRVRSQPVNVQAPDGVRVPLVNGPVGQRLEVPDPERGVLTARQKVSARPGGRGRRRRRVGNESRRENRTGVTSQRATVAKCLRRLIAGSGLLLFLFLLVAEITSEQEFLMRPQLTRK